MATLKMGSTTVLTDTTLANAVQDNVTRLGTVTTGTMNNTIGSSAIFPAGHVVQTKSTRTVGQVGVGGDSWSTSQVHGVLEITPVFASSDILLWFSATTYCDSTAGYLYTDVYKNASDVTETANLSGNTGGALTDGTRMWTTMSFSFLDTCSENSLTTKTYKMSARSNSSGGTAYLGWGTPSPTIITAQEIYRAS